jgi:cell wall-associated NlpC family hydrolase
MSHVSIAAERQALVDRARAWIGTPYKHGAMIEGKGCDCATFIVGVLQQCGLMSGEHLAHFSPDWWAHAKTDAYLLGMMRNATKLAETVCTRAVDAAPGNIVLSRVAGAKVFNHGGIVTSWPRGIHSVRTGVVEADFSADPLWMLSHIVVFDPFGKPA